MQREIKFRGKRVDNGEWVYGNLYQYDGRCWITLKKSNEKYGSGYKQVGMSLEIYPSFEVDPKTVGQFTGLVDKSKREIYEGDILQTPLCPNIQVYWSEHNGRWNGKYLGIVNPSDDCQVNDSISFTSEVIGNTFEPPTY